MPRSQGLSLLLVTATALGCAPPSRSGSARRSAEPPKALIVAAGRGEVRLTGAVQRTNAPRMSGFARAMPALLGSKGGKFEKYFVFLTDAPVPEVYAALRQLGARSRVVYRKGFRARGGPGDYQQGDPVQIYVEWKSGGRVRRLAYEDFFMQKITVAKNETVKPWTPHFVFHGSGVLNGKKTGCIACTHDCPGGIIGNNQYPLLEPKPVLRADWSKLPKPGTRVTVVLRPVPSGQ